jgi:lipopolysaccharide exporter
LNRSLASRTGTALLWQAVQLGGVKAVHFLRILILARLLAPEDFGLLAISLIAIEFLLAVTNPGMIQALVHRRDPAPEDYHAGWTIRVVRAVLVGGILLVAAPWVAQSFAEPRATLLIQVLALRPILEAFGSMRVATLVSELRFRGLAVIHVSEAVVNTALSIALAPLVGVWALVWGPVAGALAGTVASYVVAPYRPSFTLRGTLVGPLIGYGRWVFLAGLFGVGSNLVIQLAVSRGLGAEELGLFFLATRLAYLAWEASNSLVEKVVFPVYAGLQHDPEAAARTFRFFLTAMGTILLPASAVLIILAPGLVEHVLGARWEGTIPLIGILVVATVVGLPGDAAGPLLLGFGRPAGVAILEGIHLGVAAASIWWFLGAFGLVGAPLALLAAIGASQVVAVAMTRRMLPRPFKGLHRSLVMAAAAAVVAGGLAWALQTALPGIVGVGLGVVGSIVGAGAAVWLLDRRMQLGFLEEVGLLFPGAASLLGLRPSGTGPS